MSGRPTDYRSEFNEQAEKLCKLGATDKELGDFFGVCEATVNNWKNEHPQFLASIKRGKQEADANVAERLYQRALGYSHPDIHFSSYEGVVTETPTIKHYAPDAVSAIFWLKNRQPAKWRDKQDIQHSGDLQVSVVSYADNDPG